MAISYTYHGESLVSDAQGNVAQEVGPALSARVDVADGAASSALASTGWYRIAASSPCYVLADANATNGTGGEYWPAGAEDVRFFKAGVKLGSTAAAGGGSATEATLQTISTNIATLATADPAHDAADSGSPIKIGGRAVSNLSGQTLVAANDRSDSKFSLDGAQFVRKIPLGDIVSGVAAITDGSSTSVIAAQGAGLKTYVTGVVIANTSASAVTVDLRDGAAGSVKATFPVPAGAGVVFNFGDTPLGFTANTAVCADPSAAALTVTTTLTGFKSAI